MLRITIQEVDTELQITLEGRIASPWLDDLCRILVKASKRVNGEKQLRLYLRDITHLDDGARSSLKCICSETQARVSTDTIWAQYLAEEIPGIQQ